jgi:general nucleoside transport system ATP-binding protein
METTAPACAVEMCNIHKRFGSVIANDDVDFFLRPGQIHALLGENGAGKTTLMRLLYGLSRPDRGEIYVGGKLAHIRSPKDALRLGIGMVTQHFALVRPLTVTENIILGATDGFRINLAAAHEKVAQAAKRFGIAVEPTALVKDLSVGQRQRVEILKALYRHATVLILDEPTAVLVPQEVDQLFESLRQLQQQNLSVIFISHKLHEVMAITDQVTVLRGGQVAGTVATEETTLPELARMMVGRSTLSITPKSAESHSNKTMLKLEGVVAHDNKGLPALKAISLNVHAGEILGIAGVSGNGQVELAQVLSGTRPVANGRIVAAGQDVTNVAPNGMMAAGIGRIPEDGRANLVEEMSVAQNMAIEHLEQFTKKGQLDKKKIRQHAEELIHDYQIKASPDDKIRTLSGGNMQKVILARVLEQKPKVLVVSQPTRGLDVGATEYVRGKLLAQQQQGAAILLISEDLDEILQLSDRIAVMYEGEIMAILTADEADVEELGLLMSGVV